MIVRVRRVVLGDSHGLWEIRNHELNRLYVNNSGWIPIDTHAAWFADKYFSGADNHCFAAEVSDIPQAFCRFDAEDNSYIVSIVVDPAYHGQGVGSTLLRESMKLLREAAGAVRAATPIVAEIHKNNIYSIILFVRHGFRLVGESNIQYRFVYTQYDDAGSERRDNGEEI